MRTILNLLDNLPAMTKESILAVLPADFVFLGSGDFRTCFLYGGQVWKFAHNMRTDANACNHREKVLWDLISKSCVMDKFARVHQVSKCGRILIQDYVQGKKATRQDQTNAELYLLMLYDNRDISFLPFDFGPRNMRRTGRDTQDWKCFDYAAFTS